MGTILGALLVGAAGQFAAHARAPEPPAATPTPGDPTPFLPESLDPIDPSELLFTAPVNLDFAEGDLGQAPAGWFLSSDTYEARLVADGPAPGVRAVRLTPRVEAGDDPGVGPLVQALAPSMKGKIFEFSAMVRVEPAPRGVTGPMPASGRLMLRVNRLGGLVGAFENMADRPIVPGPWRRYRVLGPVIDDAERVIFGVMAVAGATVSIADAKVRIIDAPPSGGNAPPAALGERELQNVSALARLYGLVRWFHPSDESRGVDWDGLLIAGIDRVLPARTPAELANALREVFAPIAPGVEVFESDRPAPPPPPQPTGPAVQRVVGYRHLGRGDDLAGAPPGMVYRSERRVLGMNEAGSGQQLPKPGSTTEHKLPGGVTVRVQQVLFMDDRGTLPRAPSPAAPLTTPSRPDGWRESLDDRSVRLASVVVAWNVFEHFYPYFSVVRVNWAAVLEPALQEAAQAQGTAEGVEALQRLVAQAKDGHGQVVHPDMVVSSVIPVAWTFVGDDLIVTRTTVENAPYLKPGDQVIAIDNVPISSIVPTLRARISAASEGWMRQSVAQGLRTVHKTPPSTVLRVQRQGDPERPGPFDVKLPRFFALRARPGVDDWLFESAPLRPADGAEVAAGVVYFDLSGKSRPDLLAALPALAAAKGVVFDVRGYPGDGAYELLRHFVGGPPLRSPRWGVPVITQPSASERKFQDLPAWSITGAAPRLGAAGGQGQRVAFLIDGRAISYAESILGIVENYKLGVLVGEPTAGTNGNVNPFRTPGGAVIYFTGMRVLKQDGSVHHGVGIRPTIPVSPTRAGIAAGRDEVLEAGIKAVSQP